MPITNVINPYPELQVKISTDGLDRIEGALAQALEEALNTASDAIVADAKRRAPVDTGFMRDSTEVETTDDPLKLVLHANAPYSGFVDMGTVRQAAQPWFTPAVDQGRQTLAEAVEKAVRRATGG